MKVCGEAPSARALLLDFSSQFFALQHFARNRIFRGRIHLLQQCILIVRNWSEDGQFRGLKQDVIKGPTLWYKQDNWLNLTYQRHCTRPMAMSKDSGLGLGANNAPGGRRWSGIAKMRAIWVLCQALLVASGKGRFQIGYCAPIVSIDARRLIVGNTLAAWIGSVASDFATATLNARMGGASSFSDSFICRRLHSEQRISQIYPNFFYAKDVICAVE